ncbi:prosaposin [Medicago truncatula]|uniref:Pulmonary surfactant-associated protein B n=1 Tax=Medicago truncatula TaxID=3880 RepID=A0A072UHH9_MEDTR|nr:prosaposin [Medicago truncatula]KEH29214.1 saposin B domain protein [Medicago truncatula]
MEGKIGFLFLILLGAVWACDAREFANPELNRKPDACSICEEYTTEILDYLKDNKTQAKIIDDLHNTCHQLPAFSEQCFELVDHHVQLFFSKIARMMPAELCEKYHLCESATISSQVHGNSCGFCKDTVAELLVELNDPETKLEIIQKLLKACNNMEKYKKECKRMVFEYGPLILVNAEKYLKKADICTTLHACPSSTIVSQEATVTEETALFSDS